MTPDLRRPLQRILIACCVCSLVLGVGFIAAAARRPMEQPAAQQRTETTVSPAHPLRPGGKPQWVSATPTALTIPVIDVQTPVVSLGLMSDGTVEVPANAERAGWFHRGPAPGQIGSAVILGHVDSAAGPAVFARLQELKRGDVITVHTEGGRGIRFTVRRTQSYLNDDFPAHRVYARQGGRWLNLVTCTGAYDRTRGGYQSNLVVFTSRMDGSAGR